MEMPFPFMLKQEREEPSIDGNDDDDVSLDEIDELLSMPLPSLSGNKLRLPSDINDEFLRLTTMVRAVYFSYLHKCLLSNYILCYKQKNEEIPCSGLKKCADYMELNAVRSSLEASLYRQNMLKLISDIKSHTSERKAYKKLVIFLETPPSKVDVGVQTSNSWVDLTQFNNVQSVCITSNCEELSYMKETSMHVEEQCIETKEKDQEYCCENKTASPTVNSTSAYEKDRIGLHDESDEETTSGMLFPEETIKQESDIFSEPTIIDTSDLQTANTQIIIQNEDDISQDSLLQHMEDMFCESDDSSDLTTLIEKHSGVSKANIDKEINEMCLESESFLPHSSSVSNQVSKSNNGINTGASNTKTVKIANTSSNKFSFSYYKEIKSKGVTKPVAQQESETVESKQKRKANGIWFVERVHQVSKLKAKMTELSLRNYRKHGRIKAKFIELFGESDDEEMMPDSPICIEEHLTACKERIAPWIVKYLMPFYKKRRIKDRQLFKAVAKHIADMLIIENTFPEQDCVRYILVNVPYFEQILCYLKLYDTPE
ncbi:hypothetical protein KM043_015238 [Ampulex compressa]|nr:hypothetical protein KM043_015238 [Ampulex compressa]